MSTVPPIIATDRECLEAYSRRPGAESLRPVVERYLAFVYASAHRRTGDAVHAADVTRAVFLVLTRRARKLRRKTVLAGWLFQVTAAACKKIKLQRTSRWRWFRRKPQDAVPPDASLWSRVTPHMDRALEELPSKQRDAVLLCSFLNLDGDSAAKILRTSKRRVAKRVARGHKKLANRLRKHGVIVDADALALACAAEGCVAAYASSASVSLAGSSGVPPPLSSTVQSPIEPAAKFAALQELTPDILKSIEESLGRKPTFKLAHRTLNTLAWKRWRRRFAIGIPSFFLLLATVAGTAWYVDSLTGHSRLISAFLVWSVRNEAKTIPGLAQPARTWPADPNSPRPSAASVRTARDLYQTTNIWLADLKFSREQWKALEPKRIGALPNFLQPDGTALLRNPKAQRSGLAGALGFDFHWVHADFELGGAAFTNVAARIKGNGTWLGSLSGQKRPFKFDLNKFAKDQKLAGLDELAFNNLINDHSFMSDALGYEFFRDAGVPAPRTAYAWLTVSVDGQWDRKPLGLYAMVETVDADFAAARISKKTPIFKPVTYQLFEHLGDDWSAYAPIYDLKTKATPAQERRVIAFARLVSHANHDEFAQRLGDFLDLDAFARFLAGQVLLSNYDSVLANGQNFYVYLDPRSNKFGFIPWDLDLAWGGFFLLGSTKERERASIWNPWVGENRFLERVMGVQEFRRLYRAHLEDFSARLFVPNRLNQRIDELAAVIRSPIAAESDFRLDKFEQAVGIKPLKPSRGSSQSADRSAHQLKRFIEKRAVSVRAQLDGNSKGIILKRSEPR